MNKIVSVDLQKDFSDKAGKHYKPRPAVEFIKNTIVPYLFQKNIKIAEIISDYRQPRPGDRDDSCNPGTWGYESEIPDNLKDKPVWVKCMNSPIWVRDGIGDASKKPGTPYQDPAKFGQWLEATVGKPEDTELALIGLTVDCCVLCTAQELSFRGYGVKIIKEAVDTYSGSQEEKEAICKSPAGNWAETVSWEDYKLNLK